MTDIGRLIREAEVDENVYQVCEIHKNVTVIISQCLENGEIDLSWEVQPNTESEIIHPIEVITPSSEYVS